METRPFGTGYDPFIGAQRLFHYDHAEDRFHIEVIEDLSELVDQNRANFNDRDGRWGDGLTHVARLPMTIYVDLMAKGILDDEKAFKAWLNHPDNRAFRTRPGHI